MIPHGGTQQQYLALLAGKWDGLSKIAVNHALEYDLELEGVAGDEVMSDDEGDIVRDIEDYDSSPAPSSHGTTPSLGNVLQPVPAPSSGLPDPDAGIDDALTEALAEALFAPVDVAAPPGLPTV